MPKKVLPRRMSKQTRRLFIAVAIAVVLIIAGLTILIKVSATPQNVFWGAINNSLSTSAVTIQSNQISGADNEQQLIQIDFGHNPKILTFTTLKSSTGQVKTEDLDTPNAEYTRYVAISSQHRTKAGKPINFSSVIGVWAKTGGSEPTPSPLPTNLGQILLGMSLPFGNFSTSQRADLINMIKQNQVYTTDFGSMSRTKIGGMPVYKYQVTIQPLIYVRYLKTYADDMGLHQLDQIDPNSYGGQPSLTVTWFINPNTRQLVEAEYGSNHVEKYSAYGVGVSASVPNRTLQSAVLQKNLSNLLSQ